MVTDNPILTAINQGHYQRSVRTGVMGEQTTLMCRACNEPMPCTALREARQLHARACR